MFILLLGCKFIFEWDGGIFVGDGSSVGLGIAGAANNK